jgi:hypothetical protein
MSDSATCPRWDLVFDLQSGHPKIASWLTTPWRDALGSLDFHGAPRSYYKLEVLDAQLRDSWLQGRGSWRKWPGQTEAAGRLGLGQQKWLIYINKWDGDIGKPGQTSHGDHQSSSPTTSCDWGALYIAMPLATSSASPSPLATWKFHESPKDIESQTRFNSLTVAPWYS